MSGARHELRVRDARFKVAQSIDNPWLAIPAGDYEGHMVQAGESAALRKIFSRAYLSQRPRRVLLLGCATGRDFELMTADLTEYVVGVDVNAEYLSRARARLSERGPRTELIHADVLDVELGGAGFDLVHAALLFEYVDPFALFLRIESWLSRDGVCCVVSQNPAREFTRAGDAPCANLRLLAGAGLIHAPEQLARAALRARLQPTSQREVVLPGGKSFCVSLFCKQP